LRAEERLKLRAKVFVFGQQALGVDRLAAIDAVQKIGQKGGERGL
jgi:hypothetical protein